MGHVACEVKEDLVVGVDDLVGVERVVDVGDELSLGAFTFLIGL